MSQFKFKYNDWWVTAGDIMTHSLYNHAEFIVISVAFGKVYIREPKALGGHKGSYSFSYLSRMIDIGNISFVQSANHQPDSERHEDPNAIFRRKRHHEESN